MQLKNANETVENYSKITETDLPFLVLVFMQSQRITKIVTTFTRIKDYWVLCVHIEAIRSMKVNKEPSKGHDHVQTMHCYCKYSNLNRGLCETLCRCNK